MCGMPLKQCLTGNVYHSMCILEKKLGLSQTNDPSFELKIQGKELNSKQTEGKETNLRSEINEIESRDII